MKIVIIGSGGRLGAALVREYGCKFEVIGFNHAQLDLASFDQVRATVGDLDFDVLINAAGFTNVDGCEKEPAMAMKINSDAPRLLASIASQKKARIIHFSTDYVFDGEKREPYTETDQTGPISVYGKSKEQGESGVLEAEPNGVVVRVSWVFGPDRPSFIDAIIKRARNEEQVDAIADKFSTPTYTRDVAEALPRFFDRNVPGGIIHFANAGECSWQEFGQYALDCSQKAGVDLKATKVAPLKMGDMKNFIARRPVYSVLSTAKYASLAGAAPRAWREAVTDYIMSFPSKT